MSVRESAARGARARRVALARARIARFAPVVAAAALVVSVAAPMAGGPRVAGVAILLAGIAAAGAFVLAARRGRPVSDRVAADLDRAADVDGALRSAHWFAGDGTPDLKVGPTIEAPESAPEAGRHAPWVAFHLQRAASGAAGVDWSRAYQRSPARLSWGLVVVCAIGTVAFAMRPPGRLRSVASATTTSTPAAAAATTGASPIPAALVPQVVDGLRAMQAGRAPSKEQLSAIDRLLSAAKTHPGSQRQIEGRLTEEAARRERENASTWDSDPDEGQAMAEEHNGFELADLEWAYKEAVGHARVEERSHPDPSAGAASAEEARGDKADQRAAEPGAPGVPKGQSIEADIQGTPANILSSRAGRQQADGDGGNPTAAATPPRARSAAFAAALRNEIVHAQRDFDLPPPDATAARRATNPGQASPDSVPGAAAAVRYEPSQAVQPPPVPDARRPLVRDFFLRSPDPRPPVKRP